MIFFIIPKTTGFGLSKRRVSFHKTTRIFFEGFSHPSFFVLGSESAPGSGVARLFVSLLFFARSCCFFACFSTFLWLNSPFFLIILVVLILCVLLRRGSYNHWKQPAKVQNLSRQKCRLLYFYGVCCLYNSQNDGGWFFKTMGFISRNDAYIFWGGTPLFFVSGQYFLSALLFVSRFRLCLFRAFDLGVLILFLFSSFFLVLFGGCCFVCTFAYKKGLGGPVTRRLETVQASAGYQDLFWDTYFCWKSTKQTNYTPIVPTIKIHLSLRMQRNLKWKSRVFLVKYFCNYLLLEKKH